MNRKALASSSFILGTVLSFILMLSGHIIVKQPEDRFAVMENEKSTEQLKAERLAALQGFAAISVLGQETLLNASNKTLIVVLFNPGKGTADNPSIEKIIIKDEKSYIPLGKSIDGLLNDKKIIQEKTQQFNFSISEQGLTANLVNRTFVRVDVAFNYTLASPVNIFKRETESVLLKVD